MSRCHLAKLLACASIVYGSSPSSFPSSSPSSDLTTYSWAKLGDDIDGEYWNDNSGTSVSISSDGSVVAIGAAYNDGDGIQSAGHVRVYAVNAEEEWTQLGNDIDGEALYDFSGHSVSLSASGSVVAVGAFGHDKNTFSSNNGHVKVYEYDDTSETWEQLGTDIDGESSMDLSGYSVSLSAD